MNFESELAESVFRSKYLLEEETEPDQANERIIKEFSKNFPEMEKEAREYINKQWYIIAGGVRRASGNRDQNVSHINCTSLPPVKDNLESIFDSLYKWAKYAAFGQGEGIDISLLRPKGAKVHNSSRESTGAVSFMNLYDAVLKVIAQQGRRGASLISIKDSHPDIIDFIHIKDKPEGDPSRIDTANLSIQATDEFMKAVEEDAKWLLHFENKYEVIENEVSARFIFDEICSAAWRHGCPGLQFIDKAKRESNSDPFGYFITGTNACSEQWLDPDNVCNLGHINLAKFHEFGLEIYTKIIRFGMFFGASVILNEIKEQRSPNRDQKNKLMEMPRIGLGITGLADYFIDKKIVYGSEKSIDETAFIFKTLASISYKTNRELGKRLGSFPSYNKEKMKKSVYIKRLLDNEIITEEDLDYQFAVACTTIAPVGTGSLIANIAGSGIEPMFSKYSVRKERATTKDWKYWFTFNPYVERYLKSQGLEVTRENADALTDSYWVMSYNVDPMNKMKLVAEAQKWIDSSISVTFNIPKEATVDSVKEIYMQAWKQGLKGITIYRQGSLSGVIITEENFEEMQKETVVQKGTQDKAVKRPTDLPCSIDIVKVKDEKFLVLVGLLGKDPYEIFVTNLVDDIDTIKDHKSGIIRKKSKGNYNLIVQNGSEHIAIENIGKTFNSDYESMSRMISTLLRHGIPLQFVVEQLSKDRNFISFSKAISRVLKHYIKEGEKVLSSDKCPECGSDLIFTDGCKSCLCGWSKCS